MTREESWQATGLTRSILKQISSLGYIVSVHRLPSSLLSTLKASVEMHATDPRTDPPLVNMVRVAVGEAPDIDYRAACELAKMCGMRLEG